jgi:hypothetical protein
MPFACRVAGGQVMLAPSAPQAYAIYGRREQKRLTTCSPFDPRKCHNWSVHRFDLDCGGVRTSWPSVVAALGPILAESLGPLANAYDGGYDAPHYAPGRRPAISFPHGFAPNPMKVARFEGTAPALMNVPLPPKKPAVPAQTEIAEAEANLELTVPPVPTGDVAAAAESAVTPATTEVADYPPLEIEVVSGSAAETGSLPSADEASSTLWRTTAWGFSLTLAALLALAALGMLRRQRLLPAPTPVPRLPGPAPLSPDRTALAEHDGAEPTEVSKSRLRLWDETWLPATMSEALEVLGVDPTASRDRIKSTVTRLRRALHPDYALDDEDRRLRERRLKQINVAWEIVSGKRRAPWLAPTARSS